MPSRARFIGSFVSRIQPASALHHAVGIGGLDVFHVEGSGDAGVLIGLLDPEGEDADRVDLPATGQEVVPAEREDPPFIFARTWLKSGRVSGADGLPVGGFRRSLPSPRRSPS